MHNPNGAAPRVKHFLKNLMCGPPEKGAEKRKVDPASVYTEYTIRVYQRVHIYDRYRYARK